MSRSKQITLSRDYEPDPACMESAFELLLKSVKSKEGRPTTSGPDDPERRSDEIRAKDSIP
jgi:hypothetical protein